VIDRLNENWTRSDSNWRKSAPDWKKLTTLAPRRWVKLFTLLRYVTLH